MKALEKTLAVIACLVLSVQVVRHAYLIWFEPKSSVLDQFDKPLKNEIAAASSLDQLMAKYKPLREQVDKLKAAHREEDPKSRFMAEEDTEPYKTERELKQAITDWEERTKELHQLKFYWAIGLVFSVIGLFVYLRLNSWAGLVMLIIGFSEQAYWTSPSFMREATKEYDKLLTSKFVFSLLSVGLLIMGISLMKVFSARKCSMTETPNQAL